VRAGAAAPVPSVSVLCGRFDVAEKSVSDPVGQRRRGARRAARIEAGGGYPIDAWLVGFSDRRWRLIKCDKTGLSASLWRQP
jgi:hypothetical protein